MIWRGPAWLQTSEARKLFSVQDIGIGGAHDIRPAADLAARGGVLDPQQLLDVKSTLISCRELKRSLERKTDEYPRLAQITAGLPKSHGIVDAISRVLSERGEVLDFASPKLATLRREIKIARDRLNVAPAKISHRFWKQTTGADHHATRWTLCHPVARGIQRADQSGRP